MKFRDKLRRKDIAKYQEKVGHVLQLLIRYYPLWILDKTVKTKRKRKGIKNNKMK